MLRKEVQKAPWTGHFRRKSTERASFSDSGVKRSLRPSEAGLDSVRAHHATCWGHYQAQCYDWWNAPRAPNVRLWPQRDVSGVASSVKGNIHISNFMCNLISCLVTYTFKTNAHPSSFKLDMWKWWELYIESKRRGLHSSNTFVKRWNEFLSKNYIFKYNSIHLMGFASIDESSQISMQNI